MSALTWIKRVAIGVVIGVAVTVGVAWGLVFAEARSRPASSWSTRRFQDSNGAWFIAHEEACFGFRSRHVLGSPDSPDSPASGSAPLEGARPDWVPSGLTQDGMWMEDAHGWPLYALRWSGGMSAAPSGSRVHDPGRFITIRIFSQDYALPIVPAWGGFVGNVLIWGTAYVALAACTAHVRRRRRTGVCLKCGYSLRGLPEGTPCPECGTARTPTAA